MTLFGDAVVGSKIDDISIKFQYNNSPADIIEGLTGTGVTSNADAMAQVSTGAGVATAFLVSKDLIRYRPGHEVSAHMTFIMDGAGVGVAHFIGIGDDQDRIGFGTKDGVTGVWFWEAGNKTFKPQSEFNIDRIDGTGSSKFDIDITKMNILNVSYGWLGIAPMIIQIYAGFEKGWVVCHVFDFTNLQAEPHLKHPSLPICIDVERTSGSGAATTRSSSWRAGVVAGIDAGADIRTFDYVAKEIAVAANTPTCVLSIKSRDLFKGKHNHVTSLPIQLDIVTDGAKPVVIQGVFDPTYAALPIYTETDPDSSVSEFSVGPHVIVTPSPIPQNSPSSFMGKVDSRSTDLTHRRLHIHTGEELAIVATSTNSTVVSVVMVVNELF